MSFPGLIDKVIDFEDEVFRNIPSILHSEHLLDDLTSEPGEMAFGEALVDEHKDDTSSLPAVIDRPFSYGVSIGGTTFPTRFSDGVRYGVWYGSLDILTTVYETAYHCRKRIEDMETTTGQELVSERRVFWVHVKGILVDLREKHLKFPSLLDKQNYAFTHAVGAHLYDGGQTGLIVESARHNEGINIAVFSPDILSNPRHNSYLTYRWMPRQATVVVEKTPGVVWVEVII